MAKSKEVSQAELEADGWQAVGDGDDDDEISEEEQVALEADASSEEEDQPEARPFKQFDERYMQPFEGLTYIGHLEDRFEVAGHTFQVRTLKVGEKLKVGLMCREFEGTYAYSRAMKAAIVAAGTELVDGKPVLVMDKERSVLEQRFEIIIQKWHDPVIDIIYERIEELEGQVIAIAKELGIGVRESRKVADQPDR